MTQTNATSPILRTMNEIDLMIRARYPVLYLLTHEEARLEHLLLELAGRQGKQLFSWTATRGLEPVRELREPRRMGGGEATDPVDALNHILEKDVSALFLLRDFHPFLEDPHVARLLRDVAHELKNTYKNILLVSPRLVMPPELEKDITLLDIPLPDAAELTDLFKSVCRALYKKDKNSVALSNRDANAIVRAAQGLTLTEAENAFAKAAVTGGRLDHEDVDLVLNEKKQIIRKSGILEFYEPDATLGDVGGLSELKRWLGVRGKAFSPQAACFGLPAPKGVLLLGAPGCGKSLTAKSVAQFWELPLLRLDLGRIFSGLVGSSEQNMRQALKVAEGVAPAVLWIDEIEKGLAGNASGSSDGGTASRVFGTLLTWMQEKTANVFVVATANRIDILPPELLRRGRFDEIFFVDLPRTESREEIFRIHLEKRGRQAETFDLPAAVQATDGFSGAEIEHVVLEGLFAAFDADRELATGDLLDAAAKTVPLSVTSAEDLRRSREWAARRARMAESSTETRGVSGRAARIETDRAE